MTDIPEQFMTFGGAGHDILSPKIRALLDYWLSIRPGREIPARADFDPMDTPKILPGINLVDVSHAPRLHPPSRGFHGGEPARCAATERRVDILVTLGDDTGHIRK